MKTKTYLKSKHGWDIPTIVTLPDNKEHCPFVVMIHGTASDKNEVMNGYEMMAEVLMNAGIASIRFDAVGNGESSEDYINYTINHNVNDTITCIEYMKSLKNIDEMRCGLLGWSQGGTIALLTSGCYAGIKSVVTWAGAIQLTSLFPELYEEAVAQGFTTWHFGFRSPLTVSKEWYDEAYHLDTLNIFASYNGAYLACAGTCDDVVSPQVAHTLYNAAKGVKELVLIDDADHTYNLLSNNHEAFTLLTTKTVQFYQKTL